MSERPPVQPVAASPAVRGAESGLELRWWVLPDDGDVIARALAPYEARPVPIDPGMCAVWRANGLRLIAIPVAELTALSARFHSLRAQVLVSDLRAAGIAESALTEAAANMAPASAASQEQWLGEVPQWIDSVRGPMLGPGTGRGSVIKMDGGPLALGAGRLRLLLRAWSVPTSWEADHAGAGLRVELVPQFEPRQSVTVEDEATGRNLPPPLEDQGLVLSRLAVEMTLDGSLAILIVPDRPDSDWAAIASDSPPSPSPPGIFGPLAPEGTTLGEAMLSSEPGRDVAGAAPLPRRPSKAVIVLLPRVAESFELMSR